MDNKTKLKIAGESSQLLLQHLSHSAVTVFNTKDSGDPADGKLFSGTLVDIGGRLFVCTASHCVDQGASLTRYWILGDKPQLSSGDIPRVVAAYGYPHDEPDAGLLELDGDSFRRCSKKTPCDMKRIGVHGSSKADRLLSLVGAPAEIVVHETHGQGKGFKAIVMSYSSTAVEPSGPIWAKVQPPADAKIDIILDYPEDHTTRLDTNQPYTLPHPGGMSGGGLWDHGFDKDQVWSPERAVLIGIQSAWHEHDRYIRAVQIIHWLKLVHTHYPDLRPELESTFPILKP